MSEQTFAGQAQSLDYSQYASFLQAVETGKWPDGNSVSAAQRELMLQAIIIFENKNVDVDKRSGFIADACASKAANSDQVDEDASAAKKDLIARSSSDEYQ